MDLCKMCLKSKLILIIETICFVFAWSLGSSRCLHEVGVGNLEATLPKTDRAVIPSGWRS